MQGNPIPLAEVATSLNDAELAYVIVGAYAVNAYTPEPRATADVDLVAAKPKAAANALNKSFPQLTQHVTPVVIRLLNGTAEAIDVIQPTSSPLFKRVLKPSVAIRVGRTKVWLPVVEAVVALKFQSMISLTRKLPKKYQDAGDFIRLVQHNPELDLKLAETLGELVYGGGGKELRKHVADARAGKRIEF